MGVLESEIERYMGGRVKGLGGMFLKFTSSVAGVPDRIVLLDGRVYFVELKAPGKRPRALQQRIICQMEEAGASVYIISSKASVDSFLAKCIV